MKWSFALALAVCIADTSAQADANLHVGVFGGVAAMVAGVDLENDHFWVALSTPVVLDLVGVFGAVHLTGGPRFHLGRSPLLITIFADVGLIPRAEGTVKTSLDPENARGPDIVVAGGIGLHGVWPNGFLLQINVPIVGHDWFFANPSYGNPVGPLAASPVSYLLVETLTMPLIVLGYRF